MVRGVMAGVRTNVGGLRLLGAACAAGELQTPLACKAREEWLYAQSGLGQHVGCYTEPFVWYRGLLVNCSEPQTRGPKKNTNRPNAKA